MTEIKDPQINDGLNSGRNTTNLWWLVILFSMLLGTLILGVINLSVGHGWGDDFAAYLMQAQAVVEGRVDTFVIRNAFTIENSIPGLGPVIYPWGYPLALAPVYAVLGHALTVYKLFNLAFYLAFLAILYLLFRKRLGQPLSLLVAAFFALHPAMRGAFNEIGADLLFLFLVYLCIFLIDRWIATAPVRLPFHRGILLGAVPVRSGDYPHQRFHPAAHTAGKPGRRVLSAAKNHPPMEGSFPAGGDPLLYTGCPVGVL